MGNLLAQKFGSAENWFSRSRSSPDTPMILAPAAEKFFRILGEVMGFQVTAVRIGRGVEVDHRRAFFQRVTEREGEILAAQAGRGGEVRRRITDLEGGKGGTAKAVPEQGQE